MMRSLFVFVLAALAAAPLCAQTTSLDGVYASAQAQRGARTYQRICAHCHEGGEPDAAPLFGQDFVDRWREAPLAFLYGFYSKEMPGDEPGTLGTEVYEDVMAYLLQENGFPAGSNDIKAEHMAAVTLVGSNGPAALPPSALVRVVGCLQPAGSGWQLVKATAPARVRRADETTPEEVALSAAAAPGDRVYALQQTERFAMAAQQGKRVQVKGIHNQNNDTLTLGVQSLAAAGACP